MSKIQPSNLPSATDKAEALALTPTPLETVERLDRYVGLLLEWQAKTNLIAPSTLPNLWTRHVADSLQLLGDGQQATIEVNILPAQPEQLTFSESEPD